MKNVRVDRTRTHAAVAAVSATAAARGLALCLWYHPVWVSVGTPVGPSQDTTVHWGPISGKAVGGPITVQHSSTEFKRPVTRRRNTANMVAEQCRSRARTLAAKSTVDESMLCYDDGPKK